MKETSTDVSPDSKAIANQSTQANAGAAALPAVSAISLKKDPEEKVEEEGKLTEVKEGAYSYTEPGFVIDTGSMRDEKMVSAINTEKGSTEEKSKKIESGGGFFARILGGSLKLQKELNPKKLGFYVPVKFDANAKNKIDKWVPTSIDFKSPHLDPSAAKKLEGMGFATKGYFDSKKTIKSNLNILKKEGVKLNDEENSLKKSVDSSIVKRIASAVVNNSVTVRSMANEGIEKGIGKAEDAAAKAVDFINSKSKKEIQILKDISFGLDSSGTKITPLGSIISVKGAYKDKFNFTSTFKVNTHTDYSSEYMGSVVTFSPFEVGDPTRVSIKLNAGELIHNPDPTKQLLSSSSGSLTVGILGQEVGVTWSLLEVDANKAAVTQAKLTGASIGVDLDHPSTGTVIKGKGNITNPAITEESGFTFDEVDLDFPTITVFDGVSLTEVKAKLVSKEKDKVEISDGKATFNILLPEIANASGNVTFQKPEKTAATYSLREGAFDTSIVGQKVAVTGVSYNSEKPEELSAEKAALNLNIYGKDVSIVVAGPKVNKTGFDYESAQGTIDEVVFGDAAKLSNIQVKVIKGEKGTSLFGETEFNLQGQVGGAAVENAKGKFQVQRTADSNETQLIFSDTSFALVLSGQKIEVKGLNYKDQVLSAETASIEISVPGISDQIPKAALANLTISKDGFSFSEASLKLNAQVNFGIGSASLTELKLENKSEGTKLSGSGSLTVGGGTVLGKNIPALTGRGTVSHQFKKGEGTGVTEKNLEGVEAKLPAFDLPKDVVPPGMWPINVRFPIPVAPAVQINIFAGVGGGLQSTETSVSLTKKDSETYTFGAQTKGLILTFNAHLGAGVEGGVPFLGSVMVGLEAEGDVKANADMNFSKDFSLAKADEKININQENSSAFNYKIAGGLNLNVNLVFEATALYFLSKKWTKNLATKELGSFKKESGGDWEFKGPAADLETEADLMNDLSSNLPKSLKGKTKEELASLGQHKRFANDVAAQVVTEFNTTENTSENPEKLIVWGDFNYNRFDWSLLRTALPVIAGPSPSAEEMNQSPVTATKEELSYKKALDDLGKAIHSKEVFITQYKKSATDLQSNRGAVDPELNRIIELHLQLAGIYEQANNDVKGKVHSTLFGDGSVQALSQLGRFFGIQGIASSSRLLLEHLPIVESTRATVVELEKAYMSKRNTSS